MQTLPVLYEHPFKLVRIYRMKRDEYPVGDYVCLVTAVRDALEKSRMRYPFGDIFVIYQNGVLLFSADANE